MNETTSLSRLTLPAAFALAAAVACAGGAFAQVRAVKIIMPAQGVPVQGDILSYDEESSMAEPPPMPPDDGAGGDAMPAPIPPELLVQLGPAEVAALKALYESIDPPSQDEMRAF
jgi:hypothetical protein